VCDVFGRELVERCRAERGDQLAGDHLAVALLGLGLLVRHQVIEEVSGEVGERHPALARVGQEPAADLVEFGVRGGAGLGLARECAD
jgi:MYXO-CTERM domain-containing protein